MKACPIDVCRMDKPSEIDAVLSSNECRTPQKDDEESFNIFRMPKEKRSVVITFCLSSFCTCAIYSLMGPFFTQEVTCLYGLLVCGPFLSVPVDAFNMLECQPHLSFLGNRMGRCWCEGWPSALVPSGTPVFSDRMVHGRSSTMTVAFQYFLFYRAIIFVSAVILACITIFISST